MSTAAPYRRLETEIRRRIYLRLLLPQPHSFDGFGLVDVGPDPDHPVIAHREEPRGLEVELCTAALASSGLGREGPKTTPAGTAGGEASIVESGSVKPQSEHPGR
jgi:hypothetical protein